jgi:hypothetical protein
MACERVEGGGWRRRCARTPRLRRSTLVAMACERAEGGCWQAHRAFSPVDSSTAVPWHLVFLETINSHHRHFALCHTTFLTVVASFPILPMVGMQKPAQTQRNGDGCSGESHASVALLSMRSSRYARARCWGYSHLFHQFRSKNTLANTCTTPNSFDSDERPDMRRVRSLIYDFASSLISTLTIICTKHHFSLRRQPCPQATVLT